MNWINNIPTELLLTAGFLIGGLIGYIDVTMISKNINKHKVKEPKAGL